jgi:thiol-disulfide isomerase/thioredoxin
MGFYMQTTLFNRNRAVALTICCLLLASALAPCGNLAAADKFKPFKLKSLEGEKKTLQDFFNKVTLVAFYYPTCAYCNLAAPEIQKIYEKYKDQGLSIVIINIKPEEGKLIPNWQAKYHITIPILIGADQDSMMDDYDLTMTPTHCLLGAKGEVLLRQNGYNRGDEKAIESMIAGTLNIQLDSPSAEKP